MSPPAADPLASTDDALLRARLAAIVESSDDAILSKTLDGTIRSWNAGAERLFGYTAAEAIGRSVTMLIPPDRLDEETQIIAKLKRGERIEHFETVRVTKTGALRHISLTVSPLKDEHGTVVGASKIARDITERIEAQAALRESEGRHRFLVSLSERAQSISDPDELMKATAQAMVEHFGVKRCAYAVIEDESTFVITGDFSVGVPSIVGRWPVAAFGEVCERAMRANQPYVVTDVATDARLTTKDLEAYRQTTIRSVICVPLHKAGRFVAAMAVHDTSPRRWSPSEIELVRAVLVRSWEALERARVTRGLRDAADRLALAFEAARLGDWSWDAKTDVVDMSPRAAAIFDIPSGPAMTWTQMQERLHPEDRERAAKAVMAAVENHAQYDIEYRVQKLDGPFWWVSAKGRAQYADDGTPTGMFGVVQDITERKALETALLERAQALAQADRDKDDFIALLAHELRNPLAPVRTGLQVMRLKANDANSVERARTMMDRQLTHMVRLIDDLLDVSRLKRDKLNLQKTRITLADAVNHAVEAVGPMIEAARHRLEIRLPEQPVPLDADLTRLAQVIGNLLTNSAKYTEPGGRIFLSAAREGPMVRVSVRDTGLGIPPEALRKVFDMFAQVDRRTERASGGLGLGLALVKGLVEAHGGTVAVESPGPGQGSTFSFTVPVVGEPIAAAGLEPAKGAPSPARRRVLVADDNQDAAASLGELLELLGHEVMLAHDGLQAVAAAERFRPELVLMDIGMPEIDGLEAARRIRSQPWGRGVHVVALSGWGQDGDRERSKAAGCDGHLVKPVGLEQLEALLGALPKR